MTETRFVSAQALRRRREAAHYCGQAVAGRSLTSSMIRAIAKQAEAERDRRAKVIHAEGELQASEKLLAATEVLTRNPVSLQLRYLQTLSEVANKPGSTIVFPFPIEFADMLQHKGEPATR